MNDSAGNIQPDDPGGYDLEAAVNQAITACDGDMRATVRALIVANSFLESELEDVYAKVSHGFHRGVRPIRPS